MKMAISKRLMSASIAILAVYVFGAFSAINNFFPLSSLRALKQRFGGAVELKNESGYAFKNVDRLVADAKKIEVLCPPQSPRTGVFMVTGQSNAGNLGGQRFRSQHGNDVINFFGGRCYISESPLLGATGTYGEYWTPLADTLLSASVFDRIVVVPVSVGGSEIARWAQGGDLNHLLVDAVEDMQKKQYIPTHIFWHQGESDVTLRTSQRDYSLLFRSVVSTLRSKEIHAPIFISVSTKCSILGRFHKGNAVALSQSDLAKSGFGIFPGVDSDNLLTELDRYDGCHLSATGQRKISDAWVQIITKFEAANLK
jgi:hypothetical protein